MYLNWQSLFVNSLIAASLLVSTPAHSIGEEDPFSDTSFDRRIENPFGEEDPFEQGDPLNSPVPFSDEDPFGTQDPFADVNPLESDTDPFDGKSPDIFRAEGNGSLGSGRSAAHRGWVQKQHEERLRKLGIYSIDSISRKKRMMLQRLRETTSVSFDGITLEELASHMWTTTNCPFCSTDLNLLTRALPRP